MVAYRKTIYENYHQNHVNREAVDHSKLLAQQSFYYTRELVPLLPSNQGADITDIGCGYGSFVHAAKSAGYTAVKGIDLSPDQVKVAHELGISEVELKSADDFFAAHGQVDCIVGVDIIEHFTKDELIVFLKQCLNHLKPGGSVLFRTPNMDAPQASVYAYADISHETFLNKSSATQALLSCGFHNVTVLPSMILNRNPIKELLRKAIWSCVKFSKKLELFASARTWGEVEFSPNIIIRAYKS